MAKYKMKDKEAYLKYYKDGGKVPFGKWLLRNMSNKKKTVATKGVQSGLEAAGISSKEMPSDVDKRRRKRR